MKAPTPPSNNLHQCLRGVNGVTIGSSQEVQETCGGNDTARSMRRISSILRDALDIIDQDSAFLSLTNHDSGPRGGNNNTNNNNNPDFPTN
ncbi:expressed unknown protein [Seminavis robusta]|uniref:Uncharacterized protein n=1 Tax=Seminavis robusta TaxID=568900 RepID=A0A9N8DRR5_9STRA|nr:expressed unknown protein [Seminavis robusta]|eukprot:Sro242_g096520.1 n/a (91) ;mRNA; f:3833-4105